MQLVESKESLEEHIRQHENMVKTFEFQRMETSSLVEDETGNDYEAITEELRS
jgi:hypothetical protein